MEKAYLDFVLKGMDPMFDAVHGPYDRQLIMAGTMSRFLNCDSLLDLSYEFSGLKKWRTKEFRRSGDSENDE